MTRPQVNFQVAAIVNPNGFKPGLYYFVEYLGTGFPRKVSRYLTSAKTATEKAVMYEAKYAAGDRHWPAVTRVDELRDSQYVVETFAEKRARERAESLAKTMKAIAASRTEVTMSVKEDRKVVIEFTEDEVRNLHAVLYAGIAAKLGSKADTIRLNLARVIKLAYGDDERKSHAKATVRTAGGTARYFEDKE